MKFEYWGQKQPRWEWEKTKKVIVFAIDDKLSVAKPRVIRFVKELLKEFVIPLDVIDGNQKYSVDLPPLKETLSESMSNNKIDFENFRENLRKIRDEGKERLSYAVVILVDKEKYEIFDRTSQKPPYYGEGDANGLVILRFTHKKSVRHELAHMLGLSHHVPPRRDCIMNWECPTSSFCEDCRQTIQKLWLGELKRGEASLI